MGPDGPELRAAAVDGGHAEEVLEAVVGGEGVALHVEEDVARRRGREEAEAQPVLDGLDELVADDARPPLFQLEAGLGTEALGHGSLDAGHGRGPGGGGQGGDIGSPAAASLRAWLRRMPATRERWSSRRRRSSQTSAHRQTPQWATGQV